MRLFEDLTIKFETPGWSKDPELGLIDTILEQHPELIRFLSDDITAGIKHSPFGRQDTPSVEQIVRAAIYKELKGIDYRELEYHQEDSRICALFVKIDELRPYSFQMYQKYISRIKPESLEALLVELNKIAIDEGIESLDRIRQDSTVVETNIHYPTNNSLVWDCIKESYRLLGHLKEQISTLSYYDYRNAAKRTYFKINVTKRENARKDLFAKQLVLFTKTINQVSNVVKKNASCNLGIETGYILMALESHLEVMRKVYDMAYRIEINKEKLPASEKIFSIYEPHTDMIVKGSRETKFGHKVDLCSGKGNLILYCRVLQGNPSDSNLFSGAVDSIINDYGDCPKSYATDGGYASLANREYALEKGVLNVVFNKIVGSMRNIASSKNMETRLKKWRSGMEAVISNLKRGYDLARCTWKGWAHFRAKVLWSVIAYNIRVMTAHMVQSVT